MSQSEFTRETEHRLGGPLLFVAPISTDTAQGHIREAMKLMRRLSRSLNAYASDDAFGEPNDADIAIEELGLALERLV